MGIGGLLGVVGGGGRVALGFVWDAGRRHRGSGAAAPRSGHDVKAGGIIGSGTGGGGAWVCLGGEGTEPRAGGGHTSEGARTSSPRVVRIVTRSSRGIRPRPSRSNTRSAATIWKRGETMGGRWVTFGRRYGSCLPESRIKFWGLNPTNPTHQRMGHDRERMENRWGKHFSC